MRKLGLALCLFLGLAPAQALAQVGPANAILCNQAAQVPVGTIGQSRIVTGQAGATIVICGWEFTNTGATGTVDITSGSGTNCGTNSTVLTPNLAVNSSSPLVDHVPYAVISIPLTTPPTDVCVGPSVATFSGIVWISQFH